MSISAADVARLQGARQSIDLTVNAVPLVTVATALINQTNFVYPMASIIVDTTVNWSNVKVGQAFRIKDLSGHTVTWGVVRLAPTSTILYIDAKSQGDPGAPQSILAALGNNYPIEIFKHRPPWAIFSSIRNNVIYKQWDITPGTNLSSPAPIVILGGHRQGYVDPSTGLLRQTFDASGSLPWTPKTISSYSWFIDGATLITGTLSSSSITVDFPAGFYCITCVITDSAGKTHTGFRYVWANTYSGSTAPISLQRQWDWQDDREDRTGRSATLILYGNLATDEIYPGQMFHFYEKALYNDQPLDAESNRVSTFVGYAGSWAFERDRFVPKATIGLEGPGVIAKRIAAVSQQMSEAAAPTGWNKVPSSLSNPIGAFWYVLHWHVPNLLAGHDVVVDPYIRSLRKQSFVFQAKSIAEQLALIQSLTLGSLGSRSDGTWVLLPSAQYMNNTNRNALDLKYVWTQTDIKAPLSYDEGIQENVGQVKGFCFAYSGGALPRPYTSIAPGPSSSQSSTQESITFIVPPGSVSLERDRVYEITGHHFALLNNPKLLMSVDVNRNIDIAEPMDTNVWHQITVDASFDPLGRGINIRALAHAVNRKYNRTERGLSKSITVEWEPEAFGTPGVFLPVERGGAKQRQIGGINPQVPPVYNPPATTGIYAPILPSGVSQMKLFALGVNAGNYSAMKADLVDLVNGGANWTIMTTFPGQTQWACADPFNYARRVVIVKASGGIYKCDNCWAGGATFTLLASNATLFGSSTRYPSYVVMSHNKKNWILVTSGNMCTVSFDLGATWSTPVAMDGAADSYDTSASAFPPNYPVAISNFNDATTGIVYAVHNIGGGSNAHIALYRTTDYGLTWAARKADLDTLVATANAALGIPYLLADGTPNLGGNSEYLYLALDNNAATVGAILRSTDGGLNWTHIYDDSSGLLPQGGGVRPLVISPDNGGLMYDIFKDAALNFVVGKSTDGGVSWAQMMTLPALSQTPSLTVWSVGGGLYFLAFNVLANPYLLLSVDAGVTTLDVTPNPSALVHNTIFAEFDLSDYIPPS